MHMKISSSKWPIFGILFCLLLTGMARAQSVDVFFGLNSLAASQPPGKLQLGQGGLAWSVGETWFPVRHWGIGGEVFWQSGQPTLLGQPMRPLYWDGYVDWMVKEWKGAHPTQLELMAGLGAQNLSLISSHQLCGTPGGCATVTGSNRLALHFGAAYKLYFTRARSWFLRPEADLYYVHNNYEFGTDFIWRYGISLGWSGHWHPAPSVIPQPALSLHCQAHPNSATVGATIRIICEPRFPGEQYRWSTNGGQLSTHGYEALLRTQGVMPGMYAVKILAATHGDWAHAALATAPVELKTYPLQPPIITAVEATPRTVMSGHNVTLMAVAHSAAGRSLQYAWKTPGGTITNRHRAQAIWNTHGVPAGLARIRVRVTDSLGLAAHAGTRVRVQAAPAPAPAVTALLFRNRMKDIYFGFNSATITEYDEGILRQDAAWLRRHPQIHFLLAGYYDSRGTPAYNHQLALRRARAAQQYLSHLGISLSRIRLTTVWGHPFCTAADSACYARNRRVHFIMTTR